MSLAERKEVINIMENSKQSVVKLEFPFPKVFFHSPQSGNGRSHSRDSRVPGNEVYSVTDERKRKSHAPSTISVCPTTSRTSWTVGRRMVDYRAFSLRVYLFIGPVMHEPCMAADASDDWDEELSAVSAVTSTAFRFKTDMWCTLLRCSCRPLIGGSSHGFQHSVAQFIFCCEIYIL